MISLGNDEYRYGFSSGNVYRLKEGLGLEVRNLESGLWERTENSVLQAKFMFGKGILPKGAEEADKIFKALQASLNKH